MEETKIAQNLNLMIAFVLASLFALLMRYVCILAGWLAGFWVWGERRRHVCNYFYWCIYVPM